MKHCLAIPQRKERAASPVDFTEVTALGCLGFHLPGNQVTTLWPTPCLPFRLVTCCPPGAQIRVKGSTQCPQGPR